MTESTAMGRPELERLPRQRPPALDQQRLRHGRPAEAGEPQIFMSQVALRELITHSSANLESELGGVLLGQAYWYEDALYVSVLAALPAVSHDHGPVHFTFTADAWSQIHQDRAEAYGDLNIVGWYHTHPDLGVFFSADDVVVQSAAFVMPWQVALVVDPVRGELAFFAWENETINPITGFWELLDVEATASIDWITLQAAVWQEREGRGQPWRDDAQSRQRIYMPPTVWLALPPLRRWLGPLLAAAGLILFLAWLLALTQRMNRLETVALAMADRLAEADQVAGRADCPDPRLRIAAPLPGQDLIAGEEVMILGTADYPVAHRYRLAVRPHGGESWVQVATLRRERGLGRLATWDTTAYSPGVYELQLVAVDRDQLPVVVAGAAGSTATRNAEADAMTSPATIAQCTIRLQLIAGAP